MTDKELLTLAAKAAGIKLLWWNGVYKDVTGADPNRCMTSVPIWNPLNIETGDALRLAVKLMLEIYIHEDDTQCIGPNLHSAIETHKGDPYAATRRAIVRAAAEIGRGME
jgi:hypothetical protein